MSYTKIAIHPALFKSHELIANLGDVNYIDHGGFLVLKNKETESFSVEEVCPIEDYDSRQERWEVRRFDLERHTYIDGVLSDNEFHPDSPAWYAEDIPAIAICIGCQPEDLIAWFCSDNPVEQALGYRAIASYWGMTNFDSYPLSLNREEVEQRYRSAW